MFNKEESSDFDILPPFSEDDKLPEFDPGEMPPMPDFEPLPPFKGDDTLPEFDPGEMPAMPDFPPMPSYPGEAAGSEGDPIGDVANLVENTMDSYVAEQLKQRYEFTDAQYALFDRVVSHDQAAWPETLKAHLGNFEPGQSLTAELLDSIAGWVKAQTVI